MKRVLIIIAILCLFLQFSSFSEQESINYVTIWNNGGTIAETDYFPENDWVISNDGKYACKITEVHTSNYGTLVIKFKIGAVNNDTIKSLVTGESEMGENDFATMMEKNWGMQISSNVTSFTLERDNTYVYKCSYRYIDEDSFSESGTINYDFSVNDIPEDLFDSGSNLNNEFEKETTLGDNDIKATPIPKQNWDKDSSSNVEIGNTVEDRTQVNEDIVISENVKEDTLEDKNIGKTEYSLSVNGVYVPLVDDQDHRLCIYTINDNIYVPIVPFLNALGIDYSIENDKIIVIANQSFKASSEEDIDYYAKLLPEEKIYVDAIAKKANSFKNPSSIISKYLFYIGSSETDGYLFITELSAQNSFGGYTSKYYMVVSDGTASFWTEIDEEKAIELIAEYGDTQQQEFNYSRINNAIKQKIKELGF